MASLTPGGEYFRKYWQSKFESKEGKESDLFWRKILLIDYFNAVCKNISTSDTKLGNDSRNAIKLGVQQRGT